MTSWPHTRTAAIRATTLFLVPHTNIIQGTRTTYIRIVSYSIISIIPIIPGHTYHLILASYVCALCVFYVLYLVYDSKPYKSRKESQLFVTKPFEFVWYNIFYYLYLEY